MEKILLQANRRTRIGKKVKVLRREGKLPAIIYGKGVVPVPIVMDRIEATKVLRDVSRANLLVIDVDGEEYNALVRDRQRDFITGEYQHVDFLSISMTETVRTEVNVFLEGMAPATENFDAVLITGLDRLEVEALPADLPESIAVDVSGLENVGNAIYVKDLVLSDAVTLLSDPEEMVVLVSSTFVEEVEEEEEIEELVDMDVEPEVIEKGKKEEEEEDEE